MGIRSTARTWLAGGAAGAVLLLLITWFAIVSPELSSASDLRDQAQSSSDQNAVLERKVATLRTDFANIDSLTTQLAAQRLALPTGSGLPDFTRQLTGQASAAGETLTSITTGEPTLVAMPVATVVPAAPTGDAAATPSTAPVAATDPAAAAADQLLSIPVTVVVDGPLAGHRALLTALQQDGPRRALVGSVVLAPAGGAATSSVDGTTTMTLTLQVFVAPKPDPAAATATDAAAPTTSATTPG